MKRLYRSPNQKMIAGVCGGVAEYFNVDPTIVRLAWVLFGFAAGSGILAYIVAWIIVPVEP
jgi:phage shock protein C